MKTEEELIAEALKLGATSSKAKAAPEESKAIESAKALGATVDSQTKPQTQPQESSPIIGNPGAARLGQSGGTDSTGAAVRGLTEGVASIPSLLSIPIIKFMKNLGIDPHLPGNADSINGAIESLYNDIGIPEAQSEKDKLIQALYTGLGGAGSGFGLGKAMELGGVAPKTAQSLTAEPAKQALIGGVSSVAGQGAADAAGAMGADEKTQGVINFLTSLGTGAALFRPGSAMSAATKIAMGKDDGSSLGKLLKLGADGNQQAIDKIVELSDQNPELIASAQRLGITLPPDVTSRNPILQAAVGQARSKIGQNSAEWGQTLRELRDKGDEVLQKAGAVYGQSGPSLSDVSGSIKDRMVKTSAELKAVTDPLYAKLDTAMPLPTRVQAPATIAMIKEMGDNVGGVDKLSPDIQRLYAVLNDKAGPTFGYLKAEISKIGQDVGKKLGNKLYPNTDDVSLGHLYDALKADREGAIRAIGDPDLNEALDTATKIYRQKKLIDEKTVDLFGEELSKNLESTLGSSLSADARGKSSGKFLELLNKVPEDQRKEAVATALASISHSSANGGGFDITKFANNYRTLRDNPATYSAIVKEIGKDGNDLLMDLYKVSDATSKAMQLTSKTGASLQNPTMNALETQGIISRFLDSGTGRTIVSGTGAAMGSPAGFVGSALGAGATSALSNLLAKGSGNTVDKLGQLFASRKFQQAVLDPSNLEKQAALSASDELKGYAKVIGIPPTQRAAWLGGLLRTSGNTDTADVNRPKSPSDLARAYQGAQP